MAKDYTIKTIFQGVDKTSKVLGKMQAKVAKFTDTASKRFRKLDRAMSGVAGGMTKAFKKGFTIASGAAVTLGVALWKVMDAFSTFENAEAAFTPLMGGIEGARALVERLKKEAATTPFQFENLANTAAQLLPMMNRDIDKTTETMRMMGDVAGGNVQKMESITRGYMKALLKGKVDMESLNMIAEAGVPIFDQLAKAMGKETGVKFFKMISAGKVKTEDLNKAFKNMTSEGGLFYKGMDLASATLSGRISTLKDNATDAAAELGSVLAPTIKDIVDKSIAFIPVIKQWVVANKDLIRTRVNAFMAKLPGYLDSIYETGKQLVSMLSSVYQVISPVLKSVVQFIKYVGPGNMAKVVAGFYLVTGAVKGVSKSLDLLNSAANLNFKAIAKGGGVLAAALAGYKIGTLMYDNFVKPLIEAQDRLDKLSGDVADTMGRDATKRSTGQLKKDISKVKETRAAFEGNTMTKIMDALPMTSFFTDYSRLKLNQEQKRLEGTLSAKEKLGAMANQVVNGKSEMSAWEVSSPEVSTTETSNETKIISEVTIRDETGKARVTRGKNGVGGLQLIHTGGGR